MFSFAVVSGAIGLYLINDNQFGERDGNVVLSLAIVISVGINAARVADPRGVLGPRRPADAVPARLHRAVHRRHVLHRGRRRRSSASPCSSSANFAYQAALIYYDATLKTVSTPAEPRPAVGDRDRDRLLRDGVHRPADLPARHPGRGPLPAHGDPVPGLRDPDLLVRARAAPARRAAGDPGGRRRTRSASSAVDRARPARSRACGASCSGASSTPTRSTPSSSS